MINKEKFSVRIREGHLERLTDPYNGKVEVYVTLKGESLKDEDAFAATLFFQTPENLEDEMSRYKTNCIGPGLPPVIVRKLTKEIIEETVAKYFNDMSEGYWIKLYHFATVIDESVLNRLQAESIKEKKEIELEYQLDRLKEEVDKLEGLDESKKSDLLAWFDKLILKDF